MYLSLLSSITYKSSAFSICCLLSVAVISGCNSPEKIPANPYDYFPLELGQYQIYQVSEEVYSSGQKNPIKKKWYEKDEITRLSEDSEGNNSFIVSRSVRYDTTANWQKIKEYSVHSYPEKILVNLDNEILMPLVFPYNPDVEWDCYQHFNINRNDPRAGYLFHYEDMDQAVKLDSQDFAKTLKVSERTDTTGQTFFSLGYKKYALGIGLIHDEQTDFVYLQENGNLIGYKTIDSGTSRIRKIIDYKK